MTDPSSTPPPLLGSRGGAAVAVRQRGKVPSRRAWVRRLVGVIFLAAVLVIFTLSRPPTGVEAPEGATRSDDELLSVLASLTVEPEPVRNDYERDLFDHWGDEDRDGCDTRCEVLAAQRDPDGFWLSEWDGYSTDDPSELQVDHVVALAEAWDSGADEWSATQRNGFADYMPNLLAVTAASNMRKSDKDAAEWFPSRSEANCLWASTVVRVKDHWDLTVDQAEAHALGTLLRTCGY